MLVRDLMKNCTTLLKEIEIIREATFLERDQTGDLFTTLIDYVEDSENCIILSDIDFNLLDREVKWFDISQFYGDAINYHYKLLICVYATDSEVEG